MNQQELTSLTVSRLLSESGFSFPAEYAWFYSFRKSKHELKRISGSGTLGFRAYSKEELLNVIPVNFNDIDFITKKYGHKVNKPYESDISWETEADAIGWYIFLLLKSKKISIVDVNIPSPRGAVASSPGS